MMIRNRGIKSNWIDGTLCTGGDLRLSRDSAAAHGDWIVALDASSTRVAGSVAAMALAQGASASQVTVTMASQITSEILTANASELLTTEEVREWDEKAGKSRVYRKTKYGVLQLSSIMLKEEDSSPSLSGQDEASHLLMQLRKSWPKPFESSQDFDSYLVRQRLAYDAKLTDHVWNRDELFELLLSHICDEAKSFGEIAARPLIEWLRHCVGEDEFSQLQRVAPLTITVGAGHKVKIHYSEASPPWIEARLQNFFGQASTPKIMEGRQPLTLHLLAPNMRALQVTTDLPSFWQRIYPALRNEYQRKYPRHYWPEDPMAAEPPPMKPPRKPR
jgi:ATP-dependent helicase HrpB